MNGLQAVVSILTRSRRRLTRDEAKTLARVACEQLGWSWSERAATQWRWRAWLVMPAGLVTGPHHIIAVDAYDGSILRAWIWPLGRGRRP